jgi:hypothetical protein
VSDQVTSIEELDQVLSGAGLLGLELDTRYRVLAATFELLPGRSPWVEGPDDDRRVQLLASPVSTVLASVRRVTDQRTEVLAFTEDQLVDVVTAFDGAAVDGPLFGSPEPRPGSWAPQWSLEGRSSAPDGTGRTLTVSTRAADGDGRLELDLFARFDELQVNGPDGSTLQTFRGPGALGLDLGLG